MNQKVFKNGCLHLKLEKKENVKNFIDIYNLSDTISSLYPVSEVYNISNYNTALIFEYNGGSAYYEIQQADFKKLNNFKTLILKPLKLKQLEGFICLN